MKWRLRHWVNAYAQQLRTAQMTKMLLPFYTAEQVNARAQYGPDAGATALHLACMHTNVDTVSQLARFPGIELNALYDEDADDRDEPNIEAPIARALRGGKVQIAEYLLGVEGFEIAITKPVGYDYAGEPVVVEHLVWHALHSVCKYGALELFKLILHRWPEVDVDVRDMYGNTPFMIACDNQGHSIGKKTDMLRYLCGRGDVDAPIVNTSRQSVLHALCGVESSAEDVRVVCRKEGVGEILNVAHAEFQATVLHMVAEVGNDLFDPFAVLRVLFAVGEGQLLCIPTTTDDGCWGGEGQGSPQHRHCHHHGRGRRGQRRGRRFVWLRQRRRN